MCMHEQEHPCINQPTNVHPIQHTMNMNAHREREWANSFMHLVCVSSYDSLSFYVHVLQRIHTIKHTNAIAVRVCVHTAHRSLALFAYMFALSWRYERLRETDKPALTSNSTPIERIHSRNSAVVYGSYSNIWFTKSDLRNRSNKNRSAKLSTLAPLSERLIAINSAIKRMKIRHFICKTRVSNRYDFEF